MIWNYIIAFVCLTIGGFLHGFLLAKIMFLILNKRKGDENDESK